MVIGLGYQNSQFLSKALSVVGCGVAAWPYLQILFGPGPARLACEGAPKARA